MNGRRQGHKYERDTVNWLSEFTGLEKRRRIGTTREHSRALDNQGVDIWTDEDSFPFYIQCKKTTNKAETTRSIDIRSLDRMPKDKIRLLFTRVARTVNTRQRLEGEYVTMTMEDFQKLFHIIYENRDDIVQGTESS